MKGALRIWRKAASLVRPPSTIEGHVDGLTAGEVSGWAVDGSQPGRRMHVTVRAGDEIVAEALADLPRADLMSAGKGDGRCGFRLRLPEDIDWAREVRVEAVSGRRRVLLTRGRLDRWARTLPERPPPRGPADYGGFLETCDDGVATGWAYDATKPGAVKVDLFDGERFLGSAAATVQRSDLRRATTPEGAAGFRFDLPAVAGAGVADRLRARVAATRQDLRRSAGYPGRLKSPPAVRPARAGFVLVVPDDAHWDVEVIGDVQVLQAGSAADWSDLARNRAALAVASSGDPILLAALVKALATLDTSMADAWVFATGQSEVDRARAESLIGKPPAALILAGSALEELVDAVSKARGELAELAAAAAIAPIVWRPVEGGLPFASPAPSPVREWLPLHRTARRVTLADATATVGCVPWDRHAALFAGYPDTDFEILVAAADAEKATQGSGHANLEYKLVDHSSLGSDALVRARIAAANGQAVVVRQDVLSEQIVDLLPRLCGVVAHDSVASVKIRAADDRPLAWIVNRAAAARGGCDRNTGETPDSWRRVLEDEGRVHLVIDEASIVDEQPRDI